MSYSNPERAAALLARLDVVRQQITSPQMIQEGDRSVTNRGIEGLRRVEQDILTELSALTVRRRSRQAIGVACKDL